eukprot:11324591-Alexandrium_andersonii.AAC.1
MSASLVGSEMCIRDRSTLGPFGETSLPRTNFAEPRRRHERIALPDCSNPVSYTHLTLPTICSV